jgi:hypothetical protein
LTKRLSRSARLYRYLTISICSFPLVASLAISPEDRLHTPSCLIRHWFGVICPSCGLTRSSIFFAHGDWGRAIEYHLFGPLILVGLAIVVILCTWELQQQSPLPDPYRRWLTYPPLHISLVSGFLGYYLLRLTQILPTAHL